ncbi:MAG: hypothetical protein EBZ91_14030 [Gammaproteobacteria bacterium]|nr:hypothetical protein [Gammaproteobacteria bacterium]
MVRDGEVKMVALSHSRASADRSASQFGGTVVPLFRSPPPTRGWLTARERKTLIDAAVFLSGNGERGMSEAIEWILARNAPPKVKLPAAVYLEHEWIAALAAAGVEVEE